MNEFWKSSPSGGNLVEKGFITQEEYELIENIRHIHKKYRVWFKGMFGWVRIVKTNKHILVVPKHNKDSDFIVEFP